MRKGKSLRKNRVKESRGDRIFGIVNTVFMCFLMVLCVYPLWYVLCGSVSDPVRLGAFRGILYKPLGFQLEGYKAVLNNRHVISGYLNTLFYVVTGTAINVGLTLLLGYVLSRKNLLWGKALTLFIMFTMFFSGGMIPTYLVMSKLGIMNTRAAVLLPGLVLTYYVIIMRTAFQSIPDSLEESAKLDGANEFCIFSKILVPLSKPTIAVLTLYYGVGHWNSWFQASLYLQDRDKFPLQLILREILIYSSTSDMMTTLGTLNGQDMSEVIKYATIIVSVIPILCVYPFLQKYFVKGVMVGAVKG